MSFNLHVGCVHSKNSEYNMIYSFEKSQQIGENYVLSSVVKNEI